jgi:formylglycine-generating enzyme
LGIYDLTGNVWEWCSDWYVSDYYKQSPKDNPKGPAQGQESITVGSGAEAQMVKGPFRVLRGSSWDNSVDLARAAVRASRRPGTRGVAVGFRLVFPPQ